jgi:hypothetical protein
LKMSAVDGPGDEECQRFVDEHVEILSRTGG